MTSVIIVEPNNLVRQGIRDVLSEWSPELICEDMDYIPLFAAQTGRTDYDLMLLAVPNVFDKACEILGAIARSYAPTYILLLSDTGVLNYSMHDLPIAPAGHLSKHAPAAILTSAISLILAGGHCFPPPSAADRRGQPKTDHPRRRWYDKPTSASTQQNAHSTDSMQADAESTADGSSDAAESALSRPRQANHVNGECELLGLTRRQYEILVLLAKGYAIKNISRTLNISASTVKTHTDSLYRRLAVHNRNAAVFEAVSRGARLGLEQHATK